jgi:hypothetical protein
MMSGVVMIGLFVGSVIAQALDPAQYFSLMVFYDAIGLIRELKPPFAHTHHALCL